MSEVWNHLNGHKIVAIKHDDDLYIQTDKGIFRFAAEGD